MTDVAVPEAEAPAADEPRPEVVEHEQVEHEPDPATEQRTNAAVVPYQRPTPLVPGLDIPIIPAHQEMQGMAAMAVTLAGAAAVPAPLRGKPNDVFQILLSARDLGVAVTTAIREFHVIDGRVTLSPKVKLAMVNERGRREGWAVWPEPGNDAESATWHATRADRPGVQFSSTFTMDEAKSIDGGKLVAKNNWKNYPKRMLSWRALGYLLDDVFPEVGTGLYSPDELGAMTDEEGNVIDVASTEALPGMVDNKPPPDPSTTLAPEEERFLIACRAYALHDDAKAKFVDRWKMNSTLSYYRIETMTVAASRAAHAVLGGIETEAVRGGWDKEAAHEEVRLAILALAGETLGSPETAAETPEGEGDVEAAGGQEAPAGAEEEAVDEGGAPLACAEWEHCALSVGHEPPCRDAAGEEAPSKFTPDEQAVIETVKALPLPAVDRKLREEFNLEPETNPKRKRAQLAAAILEKQAAEAGQ